MAYRLQDFAVLRYCDAHLKAEHRHTHRLLEYVTFNKHPENPDVIRLKDHKYWIVLRHNDCAREMSKRGIRHFSPIDGEHFPPMFSPPPFDIPVELQLEIQADKCSDCRTGPL